MIRLVIRLLQRLAILGLGIVNVWLIVFVVFDFADRRLPWAVALGFTYAIAAYVILPRAVRMGLKIVQHKRVPRRMPSNMARYRSPTAKYRSVGTASRTDRREPWS
jgi:hypothetical protein